MRRVFDQVKHKKLVEEKHADDEKSAKDFSWKFLPYVVREKVVRNLSTAEQLAVVDACPDAYWMMSLTSQGISSFLRLVQLDNDQLSRIFQSDAAVRILNRFMKTIFARESLIYRYVQYDIRMTSLPANEITNAMNQIAQSDQTAEDQALHITLQQNLTMLKLVYWLFVLRNTRLFNDEEERRLHLIEKMKKYMPLVLYAALMMPMKQMYEMVEAALTHHDNYDALLYIMATIFYPFLMTFPAAICYDFFSRDIYLENQRHCTNVARYLEPWYMAL